MNRIIWHLVFWVLILVVGTATVFPYYMDVKIALIDRLIFLPVWLIATYANWNWLAPKYLDHQKYIKYLFILGGIILILTIIQRYACLYFYYPVLMWPESGDDGIKNPFLVGKFLQFFAFISLPVLLSTVIHFLRKWYKESYKAKQIIAQQQSAELDYLKSQVNPHFLFNTLNSLYGLSLEKSDKVPEMIVKLSDLLSYSLYESKKEKVTLQKEVQLIEDFINLEKERFGDRVHLAIVKDIDDTSTMMISPLLLMPFLENAFKHGMKENIEITSIDILLKTTTTQLYYEVINDVSSSPPITSAAGGLGLRNLERRLKLVYPNRYDLHTRIEEGRYYAQLKLTLDE